MVGQALTSVFANAAIPQKFVLLFLALAVPAILLAAVLTLRRPRGPWRGLIGALGLAGPMIGLLAGAMNGFHMAQTIRRLPFDATAKQFAPGLAEISTLVGLGALVGVIAMVAFWMLPAAASTAESAL